MTGSALSANQDQILEAFIALVRQNSDLKAQIKAALNQDQVIEIAAANGFDILIRTLVIDSYCRW